jgi:hypothetical protein
MSDIRRVLNDPDLIRFYDLWASLCGGRPLPSRKDFDPVQIPAPYLSDLMLIDVFHQPRRYRYRLVGTHIVTASGEDRTGRYFDEVAFFAMHPEVIEQYGTVVANARPHYSLEPFTNLLNGRTYDVDRLLLPLSSDGRVVDMLMVFFQFTRGSRAARVPVSTPARAGSGVQARA